MCDDEMVTLMLCRHLILTDVLNIPAINECIQFLEMKWIIYSATYECVSRIVLSYRLLLFTIFIVVICFSSIRHWQVEL